MDSKYLMSLRLKTKQNWGNTSYYFNSKNEQYNFLFALISLIFLTINIYFDSFDSTLIYCFVPLMVYNNAETDRSRILPDNKDKTGIYMWTHKKSDKKYVGSAVDLFIRLNNYYSPSNLKNDDNYICRALLCHGYSAFSLSIIEIIDISNLSKKDARELIFSREQFYLDLMFSADEPDTYNILKVVGSSLGKLHSEETKTKISFAISGENHYNFGKLLSEETKAKMRIPKSEETKTKMSIVKSGRTIYVYDSQGTLVNTFSSARKAAEYFYCCHKTIKRYSINGKQFQDKWILSASLITKE